MTILQSPTIILLIAVAGYLLKNTQVARTQGSLAKINVYILLPILLFNTFAKRGFLPEDAWIGLSTVVFTATSLPLLIYLTRGYNRKRRASILIASMLPNAVNLPFPLLLAIRGDYSYAAVYAVTINLIQIIIVVILAGYVNKNTSHKRTQILSLLKLLTPIYGAVIGAAFYYSGFILSDQVWKTLEIIGDLAIDSIVFVAGMSMPNPRRGLGEIRGLGTVLFWRHVYSPLITVIYLLIVHKYMFTINMEAIVQVLTESVMPPAVINVSFAITYGFDHDFTAKTLLVSTPIGVFMGVLISLLL